MTEDRLVLLIYKRLSGELDGDEALELEAWADESPENRQLLTLNEASVEKEMDQWLDSDPSMGYTNWLSRRRAQRKVRLLRVGGWSAAAVVLAAVVMVGLFERATQVKRTTGTAAVAATINPVPPGRNTATLTLSNGRQILLDSAANGELAMQGNTHLVKGANGTISYQAGANAVPIAMTYNVLATPRAGQYQLRLPDGSRVWLNNESSLRYPTSFEGKQRIVELTGEGYFEIAQDPDKPFIVKVRDEAVEVLGTSFNIMAYSEEGGTQTTLVTGAVRVKAAGSTVQLKPDEQALVNANGTLKVEKDVPSQEIISWKNGFFYFGRASFAAVMRQLSRWYDVDVVYEGKAPDMEFGGKIDRSVPLNDLLNYFDKNQVHFRLEGRKLIVLPN